MISDEEWRQFLRGSEQRHAEYPVWHEKRLAPLLTRLKERAATITPEQRHRMRERRLQEDSPEMLAIEKEIWAVSQKMEELSSSTLDEVHRSNDPARFSEYRAKVREISDQFIELLTKYEEAAARHQ